MSSVLKQLKEIAASVMHAAEADTLGEVLQRIADVSRELVGAQYAALGVPDGKGELEFFEISGMSAADASRIAHPPIGHGLLGAIMTEREPIRLENLQQDPRSVGFPAHHPPMTRFLGVPILAGKQLFGMFYLTDRIDGQPFSEADQWLIETTAGYAALAIAGARLREQSKQLALLDERQRIGMDLHDGVIQSLYAVGMYLDLIRQNDSVRPDDLNTAIYSLNDVIEDIRAYILNLKRYQTNDQTIAACLHSVIARLHLPPSLKISVDTPNALVPLSHNAKEAFCQMIHEALSNVVRHANASAVHVGAEIVDRRFIVRIADNGSGFDPAQIEHGDGLGLRNMRQRAAHHNGSLLIDSAPQHGTTITLILPVTSIM